MALLGGLLAATTVQAQFVGQGDQARPFTIQDYETKEPIELSQFEGHIVVLDFFAHWCVPCRESSPDLEHNVSRYFQERGGNASGIPVTVIPVNVEPENPAATAAFIEDLGITNVAEDLSPDQAYAQFAIGFIPQFVIINGALEATTHFPWEVLYSDSGYPGASAMRQMINSVEQDLEAPPFIRRQPESIELLAGESHELNVGAAGAGPLSFQWYLNGERIPGANSAVLPLVAARGSDSGSYHVTVTNNFGTVQSEPIGIQVYEGAVEKTVSWDGSDLPIPDNQESGVEASINIAELGKLVRLHVRVDIRHSYAGDLHVELVEPEDRFIVLAESDLGLGSSDLMIDTDIGLGSGVRLDGEWNLRVSDRAAADTGVLRSWELVVTYVPEQTVLPTVDAVRLQLLQPDGRVLTIPMLNPPPYPWDVYAASQVAGPWELVTPAAETVSESEAEIQINAASVFPQRFFQLRTKPRTNP